MSSAATLRAASMRVLNKWHGRAVGYSPTCRLSEYRAVAVVAVAVVVSVTER